MNFSYEVKSKQSDFLLVHENFPLYTIQQYFSVMTLLASFKNQSLHIMPKDDASHRQERK